VASGCCRASASSRILTPAQRRAYVIADNKLALKAGWDDELLKLELGELKLEGFDLALTGFGELELGELFAEKTAGRTDPDDAPPPPEHAGTKAVLQASRGGDVGPPLCRRPPACEHRAQPAKSGSTMRRPIENKLPGLPPGCANRASASPRCPGKRRFALAAGKLYRAPARALWRAPREPLRRSPARRANCLSKKKGASRRRGLRRRVCAHPETSDAQPFHRSIPPRPEGKPPAGDQDDCVPITSHRAVRWPRPDAPLALPPRISAAMVPAQVSLAPEEACTLRQRHSGGRRHSGTRTPPLSRPIDAPRTRTPSCVRHRRNASASRRGERQMAVCTIGIPAK